MMILVMTMILIEALGDLLNFLADLSCPIEQILKVCNLLSAMKIVLRLSRSYELELSPVFLSMGLHSDIHF